MIRYFQVLECLDSVMYVLILNGSPSRNRGATYGVLKYFIQGLEKGGADVDLIHVSKLNINGCRGCFTCWTKTPGVCTQKDDMSELLPKIDLSDVLVLATPVYVDGMSSQLKTVLDRSIPLLSGKVELRDGHCRHPSRSGRNGRKIALVSVCGFAELDNFDVLVQHVKAIAKNENRNYVGAVLRPYAWAFNHADEMRLNVDDIIQAVEAAGEQLASSGTMDQDTLNTISRTVLPAEVVAKIISSQFN